MKRSVVLILCLIFTNLISFSQTTKEVQSVSKDYSESRPYSPTEFPNDDSKKDKKSKNKEDKKTSVSEKELDRSVIVPVTVFDNQGKVITGLKKSDFQIFVDDKEVNDFSIENVDQSLNVILLLDTSPSAEFKIKELQDYATKIVDELQPQDKMLVAEFNENLKVRTEFTNDRKVINSAIHKTKFGDGTSLYDSVQKLFKESVGNLEGRMAVILVTDGVDTTSTDSDYSKSLKTVEKYNVPVFVVYVDTFEHNTKSMKNSGGIILSSPIPSITRNFPKSAAGNSVPLGSTKVEYEIGKFYLNDIVSLSGGRAVLFKDVADSKNQALPKFADEMRLKYYLKFMPTETYKSGERKQIRVRVNRPNLFLLAKGSYFTN